MTADFKAHANNNDIMNENEEMTALLQLSFGDGDGLMNDFHPLSKNSNFSNLLHDPSTGKDLLCDVSRAYAEHSSTPVLMIASPLLSTLAIMCNILLIVKVRPKLLNHLLANSLLVSAAVAAIVSMLGNLAIALRIIVPILSGAYCQLRVTNLMCNIELTPLMYGIATFNLSIVVLSMERAYLAWRVMQEVEENKNFQTSSFINAAASASASRADGRSADEHGLPKVADEYVGNGPTKTILVVLWSIVGMGSGYRLYMSRPYHEELAVCITFPSGMYMMLASGLLIVGNIVSCLLLMWTKYKSQTSLTEFSVSQTHISLNSRVNLRYTITITEMLFPAVLIGSIWHTFGMAGFFVFFSKSDQIRDQVADQHIYALIQHYQFVFFSVPPMLIYAIIAIYRMRLFEKHGASLFVRVQDMPTGHMTTLSGGGGGGGGCDGGGIRSTSTTNSSSSGKKSRSRSRAGIVSIDANYDRNETAAAIRYHRQHRRHLNNINKGRRPPPMREHSTTISLDLTSSTTISNSPSMPSISNNNRTTFSTAANTPKTSAAAATAAATSNRQRMMPSSAKSRRFGALRKLNSTAIVDDIPNHEQDLRFHHLADAWKTRIPQSTTSIGLLSSSGGGNRSGGGGGRSSKIRRLPPLVPSVLKPSSSAARVAYSVNSGVTFS